MKLKNIGYAALIAATAAAFVIGSAGPAKRKPRRKPRLRRRRRRRPVLYGRQAGLRGEGRHEVHLCQLCYAAKDGAKVVSDKACPCKAAKKAARRRRQEEAAKKPTKKK